MADDEFEELNDEPIDREVEQAIALQMEDADELKRLLVNLKKESRVRRTDTRLSAYQSKAETLWKSMTERHQAISGKVQSSAYYHNNVYGEAGCSYSNISDVVTQLKVALGRSVSDTKELESLLAERSKKIAVLARFIEVQADFDVEDEDEEEISFLKKKLTLLNSAFVECNALIPDTCQNYADLSQERAIIMDQVEEFFTRLNAATFPKAQLGGETGGSAPTAVAGGGENVANDSFGQSSAPTTVAGGEGNFANSSFGQSAVVDFANQFLAWMRTAVYQQSQGGSHQKLPTLKVKTFDNNKSLDAVQKMQHKFFGVVWDSNRDIFGLNSFCFVHAGQLTKRIIITNIAKIFDPGGWIQPLIVPSKILLQDIWKANLQWDDEVDEGIKARWLNIEKSLTDLSYVTLNGWMQPSVDDRVELHGFADASQSAYGAVIYLKFGISNPRITFVLAKCRQVAWILQFRCNCRGAQDNGKFVSIAEVRMAEMFIVKHIQGSYFDREISDLVMSKKVHNRSHIHNLHPVLDEDSVLQVDGRLLCAPVPFDQRHPIILPFESSVTDLIIMKYHKVALHGGAQVTLNLMRQKFWITRGLQRVKKIIGVASVLTSKGIKKRDVRRLFPLPVNARPSEADLPPVQVPRRSPRLESKN